MADQCKHGMNPRFCGICLKATETAPLRPDDLVLTSDGNPALLFKSGSDTGNAPALVLDNAGGHLTTVGLTDVRPLDPTTGFDRPTLLAQFHEVALEKGYLFHPTRALTHREQTEEGPTHCYHCRPYTELSFAKGSLGCKLCNSYVCHRCGHCLSGYTGKNYLGQVFSQPDLLPIPWRERLKYIRVVRFCTDSI
jgi:hypothetical protein